MKPYTGMTAILVHGLSVTLPEYSQSLVSNLQRHVVDHFTWALRLHLPCPFATGTTGFGNDFRRNDRTGPSAILK